MQEALPRRVLTTRAGRSSIRRRVGDGDVNLADALQTITRVVRDDQSPKPEEGWRVRVAPPRGTRVAPFGDAQVAASEQVPVAPPGNMRVAPPGQVRAAPLKLDSPIARVLEVHHDGGCHGTRPDEHNT